MRDGEDADPHARKRRPAQFEEPESKGSEDGGNSEGGDGSYMCKDRHNEADN